MRQILITIALLTTYIVSYSQSTPSHIIKDAISRGVCYKATIEVDKSNILDNNNRQNFSGVVQPGTGDVALHIAATPYGQQPSSYNTLTVQVYQRAGNYEEVSLSRQGNNDRYRQDRIKSYTDNFGYHYELGDQGGNILQSLVKTDLVKVHISEMVCGSQLNAPTTYTQTYTQPADPNAGCADLHDVIESISNKMYKWPDEDVGKAWASSQTRKIYELPGGCVGRDSEVNKLFAVAGNLYPKFSEDDERYAWFKSKLTESFARPSSYDIDQVGDEIDELLVEGDEIFKWHEEDERRLSLIHI